MAGQRALITGIQGFTGRYLAAELESAGYQVLGLGSSGENSATFQVADLADRDAVIHAIQVLQPELVYHLAAIAFVGHGNPNAFYDVNLKGTRNLLDALAGLSNKPKGVLLASSANIYGNATEGKLPESTTPNPANDYAVSKLAMEYMARLWMDKLPIVITRPFNYTGVGQSEQFLIPKIVAHFKRRAPVIELGNIDVWRDFSDVRAIVKAYRGLIEADAFGHTVNTCSGTTLSLREVMGLCEELTGHQMDIRVNPAFVRANEVKILCGDDTLLKRLLGQWQTPDLRETLAWMLADNGHTNC